jgi:hypothetical protein
MQTNEVVVLAESGQQFTNKGLPDSDFTWTTSLAERDDSIVGTPITPQGVALSKLVRLPRDEWQLALGPGDPILDLHVPEGNLSIEALRDALGQAEPFFDRYYPNHHFVAYVCDSWLFSSQLEMMLGPDSNIVRWQHEVYLLPDDGGQESFLDFTFGASTIDPATAPRDTRLRRAVLSHLEQGGTLQCGVSILLRQDLGRFGTQQYRLASAQAITRLALY